MRYRVEGQLYGIHIRNQRILLNCGWNVVKDSPGEPVSFMGKPLLWDPVVIYNDSCERTARAVCADLNLAYP